MLPEAEMNPLKAIYNNNFGENLERIDTFIKNALSAFRLNWSISLSFPIYYQRRS